MKENTHELKVLLVDDDTIVRKGLKATVDWDKYGMRVAAEAPNGKRGWEEFLKHEPEIVITDIVMPEENGLDLARKIKAEFPQTKILLLSCHKDFEFAQEGIKLGASGYLLKTAFEDEELNHFLSVFNKEIRGKVPEQIPSFQKKLLLWLQGDIEEKDFLLDADIFFKKEWKWLDSPFYVYILDKTANPLDFPVKSSNNLYLSLSEDRIVFFIEAAYQVRLLSYLSDENKDRFFNNWKYAGPFCGKEEWMASIRAISNVQHLQGNCREYPKVILYAIDYIVKHLSTPISVTEIAAAAGVSRSYLSTLFKSKTGLGIQSFINSKRVVMSKRLLSSSPLTIQEIADLTGIPDAKYFSKWFKRCCGITPSEFRIKQKNENNQTNKSLS
ncbi:response regulator [Bacillus sp. CMF12]|uniref:response regulator transcription factor n=1 Tax=Bacillus sp. CMF12 TaxID=2884834 RepID=UPI00207AA297|nr:response regulator [Bacillus sp. CMF12]USK48178.1 response regulator [Bacillus sp. CMF12]